MAETPPPEPAAARPEVQVFLEEIKSHPEDDTPRLVLADWLQEHGDPQEAARGEMLRIQVLLHQLNPSDPRRDALWRRQGDLVLRHLHLWIGPLADHATWRFERGFIHLTARAPKFLRREVAALATPEVCNWVEALKLEEVRPLHLPYLAKFPLLRHLHTLDLGGNRLGGNLGPLVRSSNVWGLKTLYLNSNRLGTVDAAALADSLHLAGLTILDLSGNRIGDEGAHYLAESPHLSNLATLFMRRTHVWNDGRDALRKRFGDRVQF